MAFRAVVGHTRLVQLLSRAIARETLPPALLFAGPAGVGKRRLTMAVAATVNCLQPVPHNSLERDACGECASCRRIARNVHPDVIVIEPGDTGAIKIEPIRDVIDKAGYRPFEARRRVVIIDEADAMGAPAQSALLKILEEPPSASMFLLVSSMPDALLPTILSRCPRLRFGPLAPADVASALVRDHGYADAEARAAAADADGSIGRALQAQAVDLTAARAAAQRLLEQAARSDPGARLGSVKDLTGKKGATPGTDRDQLAVILRFVASLLRDLGLLTSHADTASLANADLQRELTRLVPSYDGERASRAFAAVDRALAALERNASPKIVADWVVLQL
jgi:DNA polymerase-3 subunit delta'